MAFGVPKKRVLIVGGEGVALFASSSRGIEREAVFSWEVPNFDRLLGDALTEQHRNDPVLILFDGTDQTYRKEENIPKLSGFDRKRFIKRKLEQSFPSYPVRTFMQFKPPGENPFYLFVALPETDRLDNIAADMLESGSQLDGFGLLPTESVGLAQTLAAKVFRNEDAPSRWSILISQHETGGLRQVITRNGAMALTRCTPTSEAGVHGPGWAEEVMREFKATLAYIARFGYTAEEGLDVMVICSSIEKQFFSDKSLPVTNFKCLTPAEALFAIGVKGISLGDSNFGDVLHAAWVAKKRSLFAQVVVPSLQRIMVPRKAARLVSGFLALALVGLGFFVFSQYSDYASIKQDVMESTRQKELLDQEYTQDMKAFDAYPVQPKVMRSMLAVKDKVEKNSINITPLLNVLHHSLSRDEDIKLTDLSFEHAATNLFDPKADAAPPPVQPPAAAPGQPPAPVVIDMRNKVAIRFVYSLPSSIDLEHKVLRAESLQKKLQQEFPGYNVTIVSQFGKVTRTGQFRGQTGETPSTNPADTNLPPQASATQPGQPDLQTIEQQQQKILEAAQAQVGANAAAVQQALAAQREMMKAAAAKTAQAAGGGTAAAPAAKQEDTAEFQMTGPPL